MKGDARAALRRGFERERRDGERALAVRRPAPGLVGPGAAGVDHDFVRDHERRVKADAELADEGRRFLARVIGRKLVEEGLGAGAGDRAEALGQVFAGHADAVVGEGQRLGVGIDRNLDRERSAVLDQFGLGDRLVAQLLAGVGGVGDEFADEDLAVGIDRMDHEMQQARNVGLEALGPGGFAGRGLGVGGQRRNLFEDVGRSAVINGRRRLYRGVPPSIQAEAWPYRSLRFWLESWWIAAQPIASCRARSHASAVPSARSTPGRPAAASG